MEITNLDDCNNEENMPKTSLSKKWRWLENIRLFQENIQIKK